MIFLFRETHKINGEISLRNVAEARHEIVVLDD